MRKLPRAARLCAVATLGAALVAVPGTAQAGPPGPSRQPDAGATVTLITGDRVVVTRDVEGRASAVFLPAAPERDGYVTRTVGEDLYVYPVSAGEALAAGRLDRELFNVTGLVEQGFDDASTDALPLIVEHGAGTFAVPAGVTTLAELPAAGATAVSAAKSSAVDSFAALGAAGHVWLDAKVGVALADSVAQLGAPKAWKAGYTGAGVTVAVLDTGYDPAHPDLGGRVTAARDFTGTSPEAVDGHGHGTHVASTVAGTGAASGGREKGVAPDAGLLVGKVMDDYGEGRTSWIIAGMEWAAEQGADIASMSLGGYSPGCDDPLAEAARRLSRDTDTLFVVAAGNEGGRETIGSPACVAEVLTVGAHDADDATASFSSRGPGGAAHVLKPDVSAPGVDILAAAAGSPHGEAYTTMSGTSMATPHVAGAAALLRQKHPDWSAERLKAAIVSTVRDAGDHVYAQGAGPVDLGNAIDARVLGPGTVDAGSFDWPHDARSPLTVPVTLTNTGRFPQLMIPSIEDATGADGGRLARGTVSLVDHLVVVPAKGTATVRVRIDPRKVQRLAAYGGSGFRLVVRGLGERVVTPVGFWLAPKTIDLTVKTLDRRGEAPSFGSTLDLIGIDRYTFDLRFLDEESAEQTFTVPAGKYAVNALLYSRDQGTTGPREGLGESISWLGDSEVTLSEDTVVTLDARAATRREVVTDRPLETRSMYLQYGRWWDGARIGGGLGADRYHDAIYTADTDAVRTGGFELGMYYRMSAPELVLGNSAGVELRQEYLYDSAKLDGTGSTSLVDAGDGSAGALAAAAGKFALVRVTSMWDVREVLTAATELGVTGVLFDMDAPGRFFSFGEAGLTPGVTITAAEGDALRAALAVGPVTFDWSATAVSPYVYNLAFHEDEVDSSVPLVARDRDLASVTENWHAQGSSKSIADMVALVRPHYVGTAAVSDDLPTGISRTAYYTAGDGSSWQHLAGDFTIQSYMRDRLRTYAKVAHRDEDWFAGPARPGPWREDDGASFYVGLREDDVIGVDFAQWSDSDPNHAGTGNFLSDYGTLDLRADGVSLGMQETFGFLAAGWNVPAGPAVYELEMNTRRNYVGPGDELSSATGTVWRFESSTVDGVGALPMLVPGYDLDVDLFNKAPAVAGYRVGFGAEGQPGYEPGALSARAWASFDEGVTWVEVPVAADGGGFSATVDNTAAASGYVSLKVALTAADGTSVEQTIVRAYGV
ncbi:S8 family peptidase [Phytomonospora endophytica]|uniref:Subtilisin family serine protease n=1 Tax=Phytomonospora endophytica TaxID=714109 RepID=A0A841G4P2_9ACTN|nr:S8 family serine peptidase [Phytomonospora endophytica]MBB6039709.1 subtilisin family serine protease [Phytomonospora endophytica]GIG70955.1 peptidase [Phytomonospora endophytica]